MPKLSVAQRNAIRYFGASKDPNYTPDKRTIESLVKRGHLRLDRNKDYRLTRLGQETYKLILASGDGPEELKEMFRFA